MTALITTSLYSYADEPAIVPSDNSTQQIPQPEVLTGTAATTPEVAALQNVSAATAVSVEQSRARLKKVLPAGYTPVYFNQLATLYAARAMKPMWANPEATRDFERQLGEVALAGFQPQFIRWAELLTNAQVTGEARDVILSDAMLGYLNYLSGLAANGMRWLYGGAPYQPTMPAISVVNPWQAAVNEGTLTHFVRQLAPQNAQYPALQKTLLTLLNDSGEWPQLKDVKTLRPGQISGDISALRDILHRDGVLPKNVEDQQAAGSVYDPELVAAVKKFQLAQGLEDDGVIGKSTRGWLNMTPAQRAALVALNIQRLRLLPNTAETGILVNIPAYSLTFHRDGKLVLASKVIVGRADRKTPLMSSALNNVVVNPPWNVPASLARKDLFPKVVRDPGYLNRNGYAIFHGSEPVDPYQVDWVSYAGGGLPFRFQQKPGANNALGRYKFNMPSSDAIYLHDTPNHGLFQRNVRALSSGCVRVNKAADLAAMLLGDAGWNSAQISTALKAGKSRYVNIPHRIPVRLFYQTVFVDANEMTQFRTDIYNYDVSARAGAQNLKKLAQLIK